MLSSFVDVWLGWVEPKLINCKHMCCFMLFTCDTPSCLSSGGLISSTVIHSARAFRPALTAPCFLLRLTSLERHLAALRTLRSSRVETNSQPNVERLQIVYVPQGHLGILVKPQLSFWFFAVFCLCVLDGDQQTTSCGNTDVFIFLTLGADTRLSLKSYARSFALLTQREAPNRGFLSIVLFNWNL